MNRFKQLFASGLLAVALLAVVLALSGSVDAKATNAPLDQTGGDALSLTMAYLEENAGDFDLTSEDLAAFRVSNLYSSKHNGVTHVYLQQQFDGKDVVGGILNLNVTEDGRVVNVGMRWMPDLSGSVNGTEPSLTAVEAIELAASYLGLEIAEPLTVIETIDGPAQEVIFNDGGISLDPIPAKLVFQPIGEHNARLSWDLLIYELSSLHLWSMRVDAQTGAVLAQDDWVVNDVWGESEPSKKLGPIQSVPTLIPDMYRVYALPKDSPLDGSRTPEVDPADLSASPFGWHDTDGVAGPEFTTTQGNNVHAYTDIDANNTPDPDGSPDGGPGLVFSFTIDLMTQDPLSYTDASVTNLFYWNNIVHDVFYQYGFDEPAGNFQENNYGNGGNGSDYVNAEALDGGGTNNANFSTQPDGFNPRMQMYRWILGTLAEVTVLPPSPAMGTYPATGASFGPPLTTEGITGTVTLINDGTSTPPDGTPTDGCEPLIGFPAGHIALMDRGACGFTDKVLNAQNAGAIGVIIVSNRSGNPYSLSGTDESITIPSVMVWKNDGQLMKDYEPFQGNLRATGLEQPLDRDSDLDNGVIAHEYGHGISNRLTGGPSTAGCLNSVEQMGEGWSDLVALMLTTIESDTGTTIRGVGNYVSFQAADGLGIRIYPYTTDMSLSPQTYDSIKTNGTSPHSLGEVWADMVWEVYWNLVDKYGFNADVYGDWNTGGNNLAIQLMIDGMKLQPCSPGFVDGRDAILEADMILTGGANQCEIWQGFAKRGLGYSADQGEVTSRTDGTEAFDLPPACGMMASEPSTQTVCVGETAMYDINVTASFVPPVAMAANGEPSGASTSFSINPLTMVPETTVLSVNTSDTTPTGAYSITVSATDAMTTTMLDVNLNVEQCQYGTYMPVIINGDASPVAASGSMNSSGELFSLPLGGIGLVPMMVGLGLVPYLRSRRRN